MKTQTLNRTLIGPGRRSGYGKHPRIIVYCFNSIHDLLLASVNYTLVWQMPETNPESDIKVTVELCKNIGMQWKRDHSFIQVFVTFCSQINNKTTLNIYIQTFDRQQRNEDFEL